MSFRDPERERKRRVQAARRAAYPWVQWYRTDRWRSARRRFLADYPVCETCGEPSSVVDHREPHRGDHVLFWAEANWRALCKSCHDRKTARQDGGFGNEKRAMPDAACGEDGLPLDPSHPWKIL